MSTTNIIILFLIIVIIVGLKSMIRVPDHQRLLVFRLGRKLATPKGPGLVFIIPIIDRVRIVDTDELIGEFSNIPCITKDGMPVLVTFHWAHMVIDLEKFIPAITKWEEKNSQSMTERILSVFAEVDSADMTDEIKHLNRMLRLRIDEITRPVGVMVTNVAITKLVLDDRLEKMYDAKLSKGTIGETVSDIGKDMGTVLVDGKSWDAISNEPIPSGVKVRVTGVILQVEEEIDSDK